MIARKTLEQALFDTVVRGATSIPADVQRAFEDAIRRETSAPAREGLSRTYESLMRARELKKPACADTGWPIFFFKVGNDCALEGGFLALEEAARAATARATREGFLRATMKHPLTGFDPGDNIGPNIPDFTYRFVPGSDIEVSYVAKGGGSECFGGTRHRVVAFADGVKGIEKCVIDAFQTASRAGAICPPSVLGVGIGGTANVAANLAKQAACLRTVGSHHPEPAIRAIEEGLYSALNMLGVGMMGAGGDTSVFAVHAEYAYTHIAGICVDISCNCMVARRATSRVSADGAVTALAEPDWFGGR